ncbi:MMPL family transporter [Corynebacterium cystitidis]|uniref:Putative drug exporter of the RND superfamily n=1 Tax=Corynebacterium cystitidis DSM 20524 TaxID=1121357 RepID=A0A1H9T9B1_9CORY|nr:MMPL family transporter [Corynebacterium cystitidis]WJY83509.1 Membrane protein YdfJ [Corynebacterium cystitidis DSM 20524]SER93708.1 putative drug exporter of the RND superfamily [Corynebacterium cystitidis DSM 20524]SNV92407.1 putative drug exporter of the RND superfamily [Corynebacterium cystitidis]
MFYRWGQFAFRFRRIIPLVVVVIILAMHFLFGTKLDQRMSQEGWEDPGADSTTAAVIEQETFGRDNSGDVILVVDAGEGARVTDPEIFHAANNAIGELERTYDKQISHVQSYFASPNQQQITDDGRYAFAAIGLEGDGEQTLKDYRVLEEAAKSIELPGNATLEVAGATAVADALDDGMADDIARAELLGVVAVAIILLFVFGGVVAAAMPLIVGILSIIGGLAILSVIASFFQVNIFSQSVITLLGLGLAIDYGLFMVSRFREELDQRCGADSRSRRLSQSELADAVAVTTATAGKTVFFSALMVGVALSGLFMFPQAFLKSVSYGAIAAVVLAAVISVTVLPALFGMLGHNIDKWSVRRTSRTARKIEDTIWFKVPAWAMRNSRQVIVIVAGGLILLTLPIAGIKLGGINEAYLPPTNQVRQTQDEFNEQFPQFRTDPVKLVVTGATNEQLVDVVMQTREVDGLAAPMSPSTQTVDGTTILSAGLADRDNGKYVIDQLRAIDAPEGVNLYVSGTPAMEVESIEALTEKLPWMALYMVAATFILMTLLFGSVILPIKAVIMNVLGLGATIGFLTLMFVNGFGSEFFNFTPGPLMSPVLVLIIAILYGLSTDYEVFLVSRMVEARDKGATTDNAIKYGTAHTGGIITAAALIMIVVAAAFALSEIVMMKYISFGMIFSLALDATLIRLLLVPAVMHELHDDNWWAPAWVKNIYQKIGDGDSPTADTDFHQREQTQREQTQRERSSLSAEPKMEHAKLAATHARSGVSADDDADLIPFSELIKRIERNQ